MASITKIVKFSAVLVLAAVGSLLFLGTLGAVGPVELEIWIVAITLFGIFLWRRMFCGRRT